MSDNVSATRQHRILANHYDPHQDGNSSEIFTPYSNHNVRFFACPFAKASPTPWIWECGLIRWPVEKLKDGMRHHILGKDSHHRKQVCVPGDPKYIRKEIFDELDRWYKEITRKQWDAKGAVQTWNTIYQICLGMKYDAESINMDPSWTKSWVCDSMQEDTESQADPTSITQRDYVDPDITIYGLRQLYQVVKNSLRFRLSRMKDDAKEPVEQAMREIKTAFKRQIKSHVNRSKNKAQYVDPSDTTMTPRPDYDLQGFDQLYQDRSMLQNVAPFPTMATSDGFEVMHPSQNQYPVPQVKITPAAFEAVIKQHDLQEYRDEFHSLSNMQNPVDESYNIPYANTTPYSTNPQHMEAQSYQSNLGPVQIFSHPETNKFLDTTPVRHRAHSMGNVHQAVPQQLSPRPNSFHAEPSQSFNPNDRNSLELDRNYLGSPLLQSQLSPSQLSQPQWSLPSPQNQSFQSFDHTQQRQDFGQGDEMPFDPQTFDQFWAPDKWC